MIINNYVPIVKAYIDPGAGSAIFAVAIGLISIFIYGLKGLLIKIKTGIGIKRNDTSTHIPFAIYTDSKRYWNVFEPICNEFEKRQVCLKYLTQSKDDPVFNKKYNFINPEFIGEGNKGIAKMNFLNADIVISTTPSLDVYQWKKSKNVKLYVHVTHACNDITSYRMFGSDYYDVILVNGQYQIDQVRKLEKIRNLPKKECKVVGLPYFDEIKKRIGINNKNKNEIPVVLVAPSWGESSLINKYGHLLIDKLIETGYKIIIRPHPQSFISEKNKINELMEMYPTLEWNTDNDNFDILNKADILISDFSGIIFDFAIAFEKPIIYTNSGFDSLVFDSTWLDEIPWTFKTLPEIGEELNKENINNIKNIIEGCLNNSKYKSAIEKAKLEAWANIGDSTKLIVDYLINKEKELGGKQC